LRVLFLHPEDSPWDEAWGRSQWDLIVDLGFASSHTYEEWSHRSGARVLSIYQFAGQTEGYRWVNRLLEPGRGRLLDRMGLDWWEILAVWNYHDLRGLYLLKQLRREIANGQFELVASRRHLFTSLLEHIMGRPVRYLKVDSHGPLHTIARALRSARKLRPAQIAEIAFDKWDMDYRVRRHVTEHKQANLTDPTVLLPSAYSNVTRSVLAYAAQLPDRRFLLATTRRSAVPQRIPANVTVVPLSAYAAPSSDTREQTEELKKSWEIFRRTMLAKVDEFRHAANAGLWDYFAAHLEHGVRLREAWTRVLESEPVKGVLCGDDLNYHTRLPLILARRNGLNAVYCSHGALDGGFLFKVPFADSHLVKGEMESEYLQRASAIEPERIYVGAPGSNASVGQGNQRNGALVFFSQPYEIEGGRVDEIYRELLPRLFGAAYRNGRKLIVKLHPFESKRARKALVTSILPKAGSDQVEIVSGVPPEEIMSRTWCGVTVDSSVALECALRKIPFFLCGWFDFGGMGYLQQFARFGVARVLNTPDSIEQIPEMVADYGFLATDRLWHEADSTELDEIMFGSRQLIHAASAENLQKIKRCGRG
jgi:hypothetical protein